MLGWGVGGCGSSRDELRGAQRTAQPTGPNTPSIAASKKTISERARAPTCFLACLLACSIATRPKRVLNARGVFLTPSPKRPCSASAATAQIYFTTTTTIAAAAAFAVVLAAIAFAAVAAVAAVAGVGTAISVAASTACKMLCSCPLVESCRGQGDPASSVVEGLRVRNACCAVRWLLTTSLHRQVFDQMLLQLPLVCDWHVRHQRQAAVSASPCAW